MTAHSMIAQSLNTETEFYKNLSLWYDAMGVDSLFSDDLHDYLAQAEKEKVKATEKTIINGKSIINAKTIMTQAKEPSQPRINLDDIDDIEQCAQALRSSDDIAIKALKEASREFLFFAGNPKSDIMLISASGDYDDKRTQQFFTGDKGILLANMLKAIDLSLDQLFYAHIVPWCPSAGHINQDYIDACLPYMQKLLALKKPKLLLIFGHAAARNLLPDYIDAVKAHQQFYDYENAKAIALPSLREILQQDGHIKRRVWRDLLLFQSVINKDKNHG